MRHAGFAVMTAGLLMGAVAWPATDKKPAAAPVVPVVETLFGRRITDNYRYMEALDPATIEWMKSKGTYTRSLLDSIRPLAQLKLDAEKFSASFGLIQGYVHFGTRGFYEERAPGSDNFDLMVSQGTRTRKIVDVAALRAANGASPLRSIISSPRPMATRLRSAFPRVVRKTRQSPCMTPAAAPRLAARSIVRNLARLRGATIPSCCTSSACKRRPRMPRPPTSI